MTGYSSAHTRMTTTRLLCCSSLLALTLAASAHANPQGGQVVRGSAGISESGKTMTIHQHSDKAVIDWNSFNIELDEHTRFEQPSAGSAILNRVRGDQASQILGRLSANGKVVLVNPNGVHFGPNATVDVNSLIATTSDIDNDAFMADGSLRFTESGKPGAKVVNEGMITAAEAGLVGLVAPQVENHGIIQARLGKVEMASGDRFTLDLYGDGLVEIGISDEAAEQLIRNTGSISAEGGTIAITAAAARELVDSLIQIEGELKAPTITEHDDGRITIAGKDADIAVSGELDTSGEHGGGTIEIGGGKQGQGPLPWADDTTITETASLKANATHDGDGGEVIVWAKDRTEFAGTIEAKGAGSGKGGFAETSGKDTLKVTNTASVDTGGGTWLLDP
ncbi:MAG: filamentous hemagglutinin N-terminal domain-containing protein, partial [Spiribacter salinus]